MSQAPVLGQSILEKPTSVTPAGKPSSLIDTRIIYCGDCLELASNVGVRVARVKHPAVNSCRIAFPEEMIGG
jgi:hypothetical protein